MFMFDDSKLYNVRFSKEVRIEVQDINRAKGFPRLKRQIECREWKEVREEPTSLIDKKKMSYKPRQG